MGERVPVEAVNHPLLGRLELPEALREGVAVKPVELVAEAFLVDGDPFVDGDPLVDQGDPLVQQVAQGSVGVVQVFVLSPIARQRDLVLLGRLVKPLDGRGGVELEIAGAAEALAERVAVQTVRVAFL